MSKAFTLIELIVVVAIIVVLSTMVLLLVSQYVDKGKDSNIASNLAILIPSGEVYYNSFPNSYGGISKDFCGSSVALNVFAQMPAGTVSHCKVEPNDYQAWAACARKFTNSNYAYCVDSRGLAPKEIPMASCTENITKCP